MNTVKFLEIAQDELDNTFEAYVYEKAHLGQAFVQEVRDVLERIKTYPDVWKKSSIHTQRCLLKSFPYAIIYQIRDEDIIIISIMNLRKKPTLWATKSFSEYATCRISSLPEGMYTR
jgi:plasmid stabilization system protein ParE